ncbi:MAG: Hsp70 family protein [Thermodesulfobacteriota bacterium]
MKRIYGIDLGTTYSSIGYVDENGRPVVCSNSENSRATPSVVFFENEQVVVGEVAHESGKLYPENVVKFIKQSMGDEEFLFEHKGRSYKPEEISSYILRKLVQDAEKQTGDKIKDVVITCPAYFGFNEREATKVAGALAGLNVRHIINEPTAAALAYGFMREEQEERTILVYDLGGGTFDVTMMALSKGKVQVICTGGDHHLGGKNWDDRLVIHLQDRYKFETKSHEEILDDPETCHDLLNSAERAKRILTQREKCVIPVTYAGETVRAEVTRAYFDRISEDLLERTILLTHAMIEEARKKGNYKFDDIILVGGSSRMPQVADRIRKEFKCEPRLFEPDEAVVKGAAIFGWKLCVDYNLAESIAGPIVGAKPDDEEIEITLDDLDRISSEVAAELAEKMGCEQYVLEKSRFRVVDVTSKSFGVVALNGDGEYVVVNLILKNAEVPARLTKTFFTKEANQGNVSIQIVENDGTEKSIPLEYAKEIGTAILDLPAKLASRSPVDIVFSINKEGRLAITATEKVHGGKVNVNIATEAVLKVSDRENAGKRALRQAVN